MVGGGYLISHTDKQGVILSTVSAPTSTAAASSKKAMLQGTYLCDAATGCLNPRTLVLLAGDEVKMTTNFDNGVEIVDEVGTWAMGTDGVLTIFLTGNTKEQYKIPRTFTSKYVSQNTLSGITFDSTLYRDLKNPVFLRQGEQTLDQTQPAELLPTPAE